MKEKTEGALKNCKSRGTGRIGNKTQNEDKKQHKNTTQKTKRISNKSHPNNLGLAQVLENSKQFFFL